MILQVTEFQLQSAARRNAVDARKKCLELWESISNLAVDKCFQWKTSIGSSHCDEHSKRRKDATLQIHLASSQKSLDRYRLFLLTENGQRFS